MSNADLTLQQAEHLVPGHDVVLILPVDDLRVMDPEGQGSSAQVMLPPEGRERRWSNYWQRRHKFSEVRVRLVPPAAPEKPAKTKPAD